MAGVVHAEPVAVGVYDHNICGGHYPGPAVLARAGDTVVADLENALPMEGLNNPVILPEGVHLHHLARETDDVDRLVKFYQEVFGFEKIETPDFGFNVVWLKLPPSYALHIIQRDTKSCLPESPYSAVQHARKEESALPNGPHLCFSITDYAGAIETLKEKKIPYFEKFLLGGKVKQVFFFDPDGNGLELADWPPETHQLAC